MSGESILPFEFAILWKFFSSGNYFSNYSFKIHLEDGFQGTKYIYKQAVGEDWAAILADSLERVLVMWTKMFWVFLALVDL